jgi:hypothetical protein
MFTEPPSMRHTMQLYLIHGHVLYVLYGTPAFILQQRRPLFHNNVLVAP